MEHLQPVEAIAVLQFVVPHQELMVSFTDEGIE
jgi:hypothetical protein